MNFSSKSNKLAGTIFLLFGAAIIFYCFFSQRLILNNHSFFLARYLKIILGGYGGLVLVVFGISYFTGFLVPYYKANTYEKAKSNIYSSIFGLPFFLLLLIVTSVSFGRDEIRSFRILGIIFYSIMTLFCLWSFYSSLNTLKKFHKKSSNI